jgi:hypothetical protein
VKDEEAQRVAMVQAKECQKLGEDATIPEENQVVEHSPELQDSRSSRLDVRKMDVVIPPATLKLRLDSLLFMPCSILEVSFLSTALNMLKSVEQSHRIS